MKRGALSAGRRCCQRPKLLQKAHRPSLRRQAGWGMDLVPQLFRVALVALALAGGSGAASADGTLSNGTLLALPPLLPPSAQDPLLPTDDRSSLRPQSQMVGFQNGHFDF